MERIRKSFVAALCVVSCLIAMPIQASAVSVEPQTATALVCDDGIMPLMEYINDADCVLSISGTTAKINAFVAGKLGSATKSAIEVKLQEWSGQRWDTVESWSDSQNSYPSEVAYYNKTLDNGHAVYYIELYPDATGASTHILTFSTSSTTTQPHYSFWYGSPLVETSTATGNTFALSISKPYTSALAESVSAPYSVPSERAWVESVTVKQISVSGASNVSSASMAITFPEDTNSSPTVRISSSIEFKDYPSSAQASPARGTYKFQLANVRWSASAPSSAYYLFQGQMIIKYIYAFGA